MGTLCGEALVLLGNLQDQALRQLRQRVDNSGGQPPDQQALALAVPQIARASVTVDSSESVSGSGMIPSTTPSATCSEAVMRRARAAAGAFSEVRKRIAAHPSGLITE